MKMINGDALGELFDKQMHYLMYETDDKDSHKNVIKANAINWCKNTLNDMPAVENAIVVTRCKDCKYSEVVEKMDEHYFCNVFDVSVHGYGFCHWAEQEFV